MNTSDVLKDIRLTTLAVSPSGGGKTHFASTHPDCFFIITEPGGELTWMTKPELFKNVVEYVKCIPESPADTKRIFGLLNDDGEIHKAIHRARELYKEGKIKTLVLDNLSFFMQDLWVYINTFRKITSPKTGEEDTRAMYGFLRDKAYQFLRFYLTTFPGNLVVTSHEMLESDEAMEKKPDNASPVVPDILGGLRNDVDGMFSLVLYFDKIKGTDNQYHYFCRTNKGNNRNAKSRIFLPEKVENVSYSTLMQTITNSLEKDK